MLSKNNIEVFNKIPDLVNNFNIVANRIAESVKNIEHDQSNENELHTFFVVVKASRFTSHLDSSVSLLKELNNTNHELGLTTILRSALLDSLYFQYILSFYNNLSTDVGETLKYELRKVHCEQISKALREAQNGNKEYFDQLSDDLYSSYKYLFKTKPQYSSKISDCLITSKVIKPKDILDRIKDRKHDNLLSNFRNPIVEYQLYNTFSRYEHYGILGSYRLADPIDNVRFNEIVFAITTAIRCSFLAHSIISVSFCNKEHFDELKLAYDSMLELHETFLQANAATKDPESSSGRR